MIESKERTQSRKRENRMSKSVVQYREEEEYTQEDLEAERDVLRRQSTLMLLFR